MSDAIIKAEGLTIGYRKKEIVRDVALSLAGGQSLGLVGVNGSGKSTLLKTIAGLLSPIEGRIEVFGKAPGETPVKIAYLPQTTADSLLLPIRVIDVVTMARFTRLGLFGRVTPEDRRIVREAMEFMGVQALGEKSMGSLSGGQRQRVFLSHVIAREAELVLLDEPTSSLDVEGQELYRRAIDNFVARGASVVISTHNIKEASGYDQAMLLAGRVVAYGEGCEVLTPESLLSAFGLIAKLEEGQVVVVEREHSHACGSEHEH